MEGEDFGAEFHRKRARTIDRPNHQRMDVGKESGVWILRIVGLRLVLPQLHRTVELVLAHAHASIVDIHGREIMRDRSVDRGEKRERPHLDLVRAERHHGRRRRALERDLGDEPLRIAPEQVHDAERRGAVTAVRLDEEM